MKLTLNEISQLNYELNGLSVPSENGQKVLIQGLLKQKTSLKVKVYLQRLNKLVQEELKTYEELRLELFKKFGEEVDGQQLKIKDENLSEYQKEHTDLLSAEKEVDVQMLWSTDLTIDNLESIETDEVYPVFLKLVDK